MSRFTLLLAATLAAALLPMHARAAAVSITAPTTTNYTAPASFTVTSTAEPVLDGERITSSKLYRNGVQIASTTTATVSSAQSALAAGTYSFHSVITTNLAETVQSATVAVTVVVPGGNPPTVSMNAIGGGPYIAPATIALSANAADSDGTITRVDFLGNGVLIGSDTTAPYQLSWSNVAVGTHQVTAKATDSNGIVVTSSAVSVTVAQSKVVGNIDALTLVGSDYRLRGWACSTGRTTPISVNLYLGGASGTGTFGGSTTANLASEPAIATACQSTGSAYRFEFVLTAALRQQHANKSIHVHGISPIGAGNLVIGGSGVFTVPAPLKATRRYVYDAFQQLCKTTEPETGATLLGYDAAGNLAWSATGLPEATACDATGTTAAVLARKAARSYDARNRVTALTFPDGLGNTAHTYTAHGLPASITAYNGGNVITTTYVYNKRRLMTGETMNWGTPVGYAYDANGNLAAESAGGFNVAYAPNALGQPTQAGTYASGVRYFPNGAIRQFTYGNGIVHTLTQNTRQLPDTSRDAYGATEVLDDGYDYDHNGNVAAISDGLAGARGNRTMAYDGLDRLKTTVSPMYGSTGASYGYNALDNLTTVTAPGRTHRYSYDATNRLANVLDQGTGASVIGLDYDLQGNLANKNGTRYAFDFGNRLRTVGTNTDPDSIATYVYDGHGRRVRDTTSGHKYSQYNATGQLVYTTDARIGVNGKYVYLGGSLVAIRERHGDLASGYVFIDKYQHTDALGSPVAVTGATRAVLERSEYEPYGKLLNRPLKDGPGYTGHVMDAATGLAYMQQRYYDPGVGRFLSVDPVTANASTGANFNRYKYAENNPYKFTDPDGRQAHGPNGTWDRPDNSGMVDAHAQGRSNALDALPVVGDIRAVSNAIANPTLGNVLGAAVGMFGAIGDSAAPLVRNLDDTVQEGTRVFRAFGENNNPMGQSWTTVDPSTVSNFRVDAGLPDVNTGRFVAEGRITDMTGVTTRDALPLDGNRGGLPEVLIPNAAQQVRLERVSGVNPEF